MYALIFFDDAKQCGLCVDGVIMQQALFARLMNHVPCHALKILDADAK
jgi:hypothetical protein